jgi:hypothetical protein
MKKCFFLLIFLFFQIGFSQQINLLKIRKFKVAQLSDSLRETSGLDFFQERLFTFNDSGNTSELFEIDKNSGKILRIFKTNLINRDWEALTNDGENFYIGDFGNNSGTRKDLKIYKIPFRNDSLKVDSVKTISFFYPEQIDFTPKNLNNDFDGEAMIFLNGKLHIFTKEWVSKKISHYVVDPEISEDQAAKKLEDFNAGFAVTDASYWNGKLYLVGYTKLAKVYLMIFNKSENGYFFKSKSQKYRLGSAFSIGQIEGITVNESGIYISGEEFRSPLGKVKQSFYFIPFKNLE